MKLTIDRKRWQRGEGEGSLLDDEARMCCLGFLARRCGLKANEILGVSCPTERLLPDARVNKSVWEAVKAPTERYDFEGSQAQRVEDLLIVLNDSTKLTPRKRERLIAKEFAQIGVEVEFTN